MNGRCGQEKSLPVVVGITGASGAVYGQRLTQVLLQQGVDVQLCVSNSGQQVLQHELGIRIDPENFDSGQLVPDSTGADGQATFCRVDDFMAAIASGSFRTRGMVVCPCSGSTLAGIANASSANLIVRAADVHLKERRPLVLVPRESPLSLPQLENMVSVTRAGAIVLPASPGFYHEPQSINDLVDFVVSRILDQLGIENSLAKRWGGDG